MTRADAEELLGEGSEALFADGFDNCIVGIGRRCGQPDIVAYDAKKIVRALMKQGASMEEALEYYEFNLVGAWVGPSTPIFIETGR